jgi:SAM-dependent methyltransferase
VISRELVRAPYAELLPADRAEPLMVVGLAPGESLGPLVGAGFADVRTLDRAGDPVGRLRAQPAAFAAVVAMDVVDEWFDPDDLLAFLDACKHALRPGGRLILRARNARNAAGELASGSPTGVAFSPSSLVELLTTCGFVDAAAREIRPPVRGPIGAVAWILWRLLRGLWSPPAHAAGAAGAASIRTALFLATGTRTAEG